VLDALAFRQVMRALPTGVTVVTTLDEGEALAFYDGSYRTAAR